MMFTCLPSSISFRSCSSSMWSQDCKVSINPPSSSFSPWCCSCCALSLLLSPSPVDQSIGCNFAMDRDRMRSRSMSASTNGFTAVFPCTLEFALGPSMLDKWRESSRRTASFHGATSSIALRSLPLALSRSGISSSGNTLGGKKNCCIFSLDVAAHLDKPFSTLTSSGGARFPSASYSHCLLLSRTSLMNFDIMFFSFVMYTCTSRATNATMKKPPVAYKK
mmetsp:Transcript_22454/g.41812  ORF Transcript_22454/g.41812 Transcript_22454/m.41812 type:complete len:221 (-) Transcript_22454:793-1455(-)